MTTPSVTTPLSRFMLLFSVLYLSFGAASPFLPAFLKSRGARRRGAWIVFASATAIRLIAAPIVGRIADLFGALRLALAIATGAAAAAALLYLSATSFYIILVVSLMQAAALPPASSCGCARSAGQQRQIWCGLRVRLGTRCRLRRLYCWINHRWCRHLGLRLGRDLVAAGCLPDGRALGSTLAATGNGAFARRCKKSRAGADLQPGQVTALSARCAGCRPHPWQPCDA